MLTSLMQIFPVLGIVCLATFAGGLSGSAQDSNQNTQPNAAIHSGWNRVQQLPAQTKVHVKADRKKVTCFIDSVTEDKLSCSKGNGGSSYEFSQAEIKSVALPRRGRSAIGGLLVGAGIGAGAGAGVGSAINSGDSGSYLHVSGGKSAGVGAGVGAIVGGIAGSAVGHFTDMFANTIYKRP